MLAVGILTVSDKAARGERVDHSGQVIREMVADLEELQRQGELPERDSGASPP